MMAGDHCFSAWSNELVEKRSLLLPITCSCEWTARELLLLLLAGEQARDRHIPSREGDFRHARPAHAAPFATSPPSPDPLSRVTFPATNLSDAGSARAVHCRWKHASESACFSKHTKSTWFSSGMREEKS